MKTCENIIFNYIVSIMKYISFVKAKRFNAHNTQIKAERLLRPHILCTFYKFCFSNFRVFH